MFTPALRAGSLAPWTGYQNFSQWQRSSGCDDIPEISPSVYKPTQNPLRSFVGPGHITGILWYLINLNYHKFISPFSHLVLDSIRKIFETLRQYLTTFNQIHVTKMLQDVFANFLLSVWKCGETCSVNIFCSVIEKISNSHLSNQNFSLHLWPRYDQATHSTLEGCFFKKWWLQQRLISLAFIFYTINNDIVHWFTVPGELQIHLHCCHRRHRRHHHDRDQNQLSAEHKQQNKPD